jgi:type I restriction enzyme, S subunit
MYGQFWSDSMAESIVSSTFAELIERGDLEIGDGYRAKLDELGGDGPIFLRAGRMTRSGLEFEGAERFRRELLPQLRPKLGQAGDTIITTKGNSVGRAGFVTPGCPEFAYSPHLSFWRSRNHDQIAPGFLRYWASGPEFRKQLSAMAHGTDMAPYLSLADQRRLRITLLPRPQQEAVAEVLGELDNKIMGNEAVRAGCVRLMKASFEHVAGPALMAVLDGSEPERGWSRAQLGEWLSVLETGRRPPGGVAKYRSGVPSLGAESIVGLAVFDFGKTKYVPDAFFSSMRRGVVEDRDVLLYKDGGRPGEFEPHVAMFGNAFPFDVFCINEHVYRLRPREPLSNDYLYCWLSSEPLLEEMRRRGTGVAIPGLNSTAVKELPVMVPEARLRAHFANSTEGLVDRALSAAFESRQLAQLRDALIPALLSGALRVREAQQLVEAV